MQEVRIQPLTHESFLKYGSFAPLFGHDTPSLGVMPIRFFRDIAQLNLLGHQNPTLSICQCGKRDLLIEICEYHDTCNEGFIPLDGDLLIHVAPAVAGSEVPLDQIEVFLVPQGTFVNMRPGVWHHAGFPTDRDEVNVLVILPERTYQNDCKLVVLPQEQQIRIV